MEKVAQETKRCLDCAGSGEIVAYRNVEDGPMQTTVWVCGECDGRGFVPVTK